MRTFLIIAIAIGLGWFFFAQKKHDQAVATEQAATVQTASPRPVSEHNWAKHALDRTRSVTDQVAKQRKEDANP
jgi:hypothetical protein